MHEPIRVYPRIGDAIVELIEEQHRCEVEIILIVIDAETGLPSFVTSLAPEIMETALTQMAEQLKDNPRKVVLTGVYGIDKKDMN